MTSSQWPPIKTETLAWDRDPDELDYIPRGARKRIEGTYQAAIPLAIAQRSIAIPNELAIRMRDMTSSLIRFDAAQERRGYDLPALLLRSESSSSSQIEHLTSSVRNVALAEVTAGAPMNAQLIAGNVSAMRCALELPDELSIEGILNIHRALLESKDSSAGKLRDVQVWIGGTPYSPHGAAFVPPSHTRVLALLEDLVAFSLREDIDPIAKAAILHAQFETIHPFTDGNGRCGRTILHKSLKRDGVLQKATLPISAGLLHNIDAYMSSLDAYHAGDPLASVATLLNSLDIALQLGTTVAQKVDAIIEQWNGSIGARKGSAIWRLPNLLVRQPVVTSSFVSEKLGITDRAARTLLTTAADRGIISEHGSARRGRFYQADDIIDILEEASSRDGVKRLLFQG